MQQSGVGRDIDRERTEDVRRGLTMVLPHGLRSVGLFLAAGAASWVAPLTAQSPISYELNLESRQHHEALVSIRFEALPARPLELRMSRSSPGRYALHEFAKNVYEVRAMDGSGKSLSITRPDPHQWDVAGHDGAVEVSYRIFGDRADGTYMAVDETHGHFNAPATFMWARGLEERPISLTIQGTPEDWVVATQLAPTADAKRFTAPNLYYFLDSPVEVAALTMLEWPVSSPAGRDQTIRLAIHHLGTTAQAETYREMAEAVVAEQMAVFGELPAFDYGTYTFLADYLPWASGDGMEHRNSTILTSTRGLHEPNRVVGTLSHEFFHAWNVERIRPGSLEPFDFDKANMSDALWFAEGFTSYYDDLTLERASLLALDDYSRQLGATLDSVINAPGRKFFSPVEMSQQAPFVDAARSVDPTNRSNTFVSYYSYGAVVALGLDLSIRRDFPGKSLDDVMRLMWDRFGKTEIPFEVLDIRRAVADVVEDENFARRFFARYIYGSELPDFDGLLRLAGLDMSLRWPGRAWLGASFAGDTLRVEGNTIDGSPAHKAGMNRGDRLVSLGGHSLGTLDDLHRAMADANPGETVSVVFQQRGETTHGEIVWAEDPSLQVQTLESLNQEVSDEMRRFRAAWLNSKAR